MFFDHVKNVSSHIPSQAFPTPIALLQHIGSKKKLAEDSHTGSSIQHGELLTEIAEIFTGEYRTEPIIYIDHVCTYTHIYAYILVLWRE